MILDYAGDLPFSGMDVSLAYAKTHAETLKKLLAVLDRSIAWFDDTAHRDEAIAILAQEMKSPRDPVERSYDYLRKINYFAPTGDISRTRMQNLIDAMKAMGDIKDDIKPDRVVLPGLVRLTD